MKNFSNTGNLKKKLMTNNFASHQNNLLKYHSKIDVIIRVCAVGVFFIENLNHALHFQSEVETLVIPAISPLPASMGQIVHAITVFLGLSGSVMVCLP